VLQRKKINYSGNLQGGTTSNCFVLNVLYVGSAVWLLSFSMEICNF
jgi:hypothetical protein